MRVDVTFEFTGAAGFVEDCRLAPGTLIESDAQVPGLAGRFKLGGKGIKRGLAIGDRLDSKLLRERLFSEIEADCE